MLKPLPIYGENVRDWVFVEKEREARYKMQYCWRREEEY
jgi:hypothetical protein